MGESSERSYLRMEQYADAQNLTARIRLHERFSTNKHGWHRWVFDHLTLSEDARILEVECGAGHLWAENRERLPGHWTVLLSDFSPGMVKEARERLSSTRPFAYLVADAEALPIAAETLDAVVANLMLHHVPDRAKALSEFHRVLRPNGQIFAATFGRHHMRELDDFMGSVEPGSVWRTHGETFSLENGPAQMAGWFSALSVNRYHDALLVTEVEPLVEYILSGRAGKRLATAGRIHLRERIAAEIARLGGIQITKDAGMITGVRAAERSP